MNLEDIKKATKGKFDKIQNGTLAELQLTKVYPNPDQPRKSFEGIEELGESIKQDGLIQPIAVVKTDNGYMIIAGERRYRASLHAGLKTIRAIILDADDKKIKELALVENIQRDDLTDYEVAKYIKELWDSGNYDKKQDLADAISKPASYVSKALSAMNLSDELIADIEATNNDIGLELLHELSSIKDEAKQLKLYKGGATRAKIRAAKSEKKVKEVSPAKFKRVMTLDKTDSEGVCDYLSGMPLDKNYKITIEEI